MATSITKSLCFFTLYQKFISDTKSGKRLQPNGKKITQGTIDNYTYTLKLLQAFTEAKSFPLRIRPAGKLHQREWERERNYWKKFYKKFSDYLYNDCGYFDNYAGQTIKNIKTFFSYINKEYFFTGDFYKFFYARKEEIAIFPLLPACPCREGTTMLQEPLTIVMALMGRNNMVLPNLQTEKLLLCSSLV